MAKTSISTFLIFLAIHISGWAQKYPALTQVINFQDLNEKAIVKKVEWTNPDGSKETMKIYEMAIPVDDQMKKMTREFLVANYGRDSIWLLPRIIIFHAMGDGDLKTSLEVSSFLNNEMPGDWGNLRRAGQLPNGAHFIIEKDGRVICLTPPVSVKNPDQVSYERGDHRWIIKRHQDANPLAIGVENVTDQGNLTTLTKDQLDANAKLGRWLFWMEKGKLDYAMSHHQFNDEEGYKRFLQAFNLEHRQPEFRTRARKDVGDKNLAIIINKMENYGWVVHSFFALAP